MKTESDMQNEIEMETYIKNRPVQIMALAAWEGADHLVGKTGFLTGRMAWLYAGKGYAYEVQIGNEVGWLSSQCFRDAKLAISEHDTHEGE